MKTDSHPITIRGADVNAVGEALSPRAAIETVRAAVASWEGVTIHHHRFGGSNSGSVAGSWAICTVRLPTCPSRGASATNLLREDRRDLTMSFLDLVG